MKKSIVSFLIFLFSCGTLLGNFSIIPLSEDILYLNEAGENPFIISDKTVIVYEDVSLHKSAEFIQNLLKEDFNIVVKIAMTSDKIESLNAIILTYNETEEVNKEEYAIVIFSDVMKISAPNPTGIFYALQTFKQILSTTKATKEISIPASIIIDSPKFGYRGLMIDCCRHFFTIEELKKVLDLMASLKLNKFHWHLTDDQAWRIEIKKYPKLTEIGAWRDGIGWNLDPKTSTHFREKDGKYGGFYTQKQVKDLVNYARDLHIEVIPEIEIPGHALSALVAYPDLGCTNGPYEIPLKGGVFADVFCAGNEKTFEFLENVLSEIIDIFPSKIIHIGGDECPKERWEKCRKCQKRIKKNDLKNAKKLQGYLTQRIEKFVNKKGKRIIGWDEILEGGVSENTIIMNWRDYDGAVDFKNLKNDVIMVPCSNVYFDWGQAFSGEPLYNCSVNSLERVYNFNPFHKDLSQNLYGKVLGGQASLWTELISNAKHLEYMLAPRIAALAEVLWTLPERKNWQDFLHRMQAQYSRFEKMNINYRRPRDIRFIEENGLVKLIPERENVTIFYEFNNEKVTEKSPKYLEPLEFKNAKTISAGFLDNGKLTPILTKKLNLPKIKIKNDFGQYLNQKAEFVFDGQIETFFWGNQRAKPNGKFEVIFDETQQINSVKIVTGQNANGGGFDVLHNGILEAKFADSEDWQKIADFQKNGLAEIIFNEVKKVKGLRLVSPQGQAEWLMIREIIID